MSVARITMNAVSPSVAESLAESVAALRPESLPAAVRLRVEELLIDVIGLCVAARETSYVQAMIRAIDPGASSASPSVAGGAG